MSVLEIFANKVETNIAGIKEATNRSRTVFLLYSLASLVIFMGVWNAEWSWQRHMNFSEAGHDYKHYWKTVGIDSAEAPSVLRTQYAKLYYDRQYISIPIIGINTTSSDFAVLAPIAMLVFITWFFFSTRRENHTLLEVERDFNRILQRISIKDEDEIKWKILLHTLYAGTVQHFLWLTATPNDAVNPIKRKSDNRRIINWLGRLIAKLIPFYSITDKYVTNVLGRILTIFLNWLPLLILLFVAAQNFYEIYTETHVKPYVKVLHKEIMSLQKFNLTLAGVIAVQLFFIESNRRGISRVLKYMAEKINGQEYEY